VRFFVGNPAVERRWRTNVFLAALVHSYLPVVELYHRCAPFVGHHRSAWYLRALLVDVALCELERQLGRWHAGLHTRVNAGVEPCLFWQTNRKVRYPCKIRIVCRQKRDPLAAHRGDNQRMIGSRLMMAQEPANHEDHVTGDTMGEADLIRATERQRLRALVDANEELTRQLHADQFQLINPSGAAVSKEQYLEGIVTGEINYLVWEPESMAVRIHGAMAIIRYQAQLEIIVRGQHIPLKRYWHTDSYEKHDGRWQVVWSHATEMQ
jgi:hypothetical protein